ncbi:hypothetical protein BN1708_001079, partial [Verticillium longisporum]
MSQAAKQLERERFSQEAQVALATDGRYDLNLSDEWMSPSDRRLKGTDAFTSQVLDPYLYTSTASSEACMLTATVDWLAVAGSLLTWKGTRPNDGSGSCKETSCQVAENMAIP